MRSIFPHGPATTAEANNAQAARITTLRFGPFHGAIEVRKQLRVRLRIDLRNELRHLGDLGEVTLAEIVVRRHRKGAELAKPPRDILDVFVQSEDLHSHQHHGRILHARRTREVGRHLVACDFDFSSAGFEAVGVRGDDIGADRAGGQ